MKLPEQIEKDAERASHIRTWLKEEGANLSSKLNQSLKEGLRDNEAREQLADRVREIFND